MREFPVYILLFYMLKIKLLSTFWLLEAKETTKHKEQ